MIVEQIKYSNYHKRRYNHSNNKTGKITIITNEKADLSIEQEEKLIKFLETL